MCVLLLLLLLQPAGVGAPPCAGIRCLHWCLRASLRESTITATIPITSTGSRWTTPMCWCMHGPSVWAGRLCIHARAMRLHACTLCGRMCCARPAGPMHDTQAHAHALQRAW